MQPRRAPVRPDHRDGHPRPERGVVRRPCRVPQRRPDRRRAARPDRRRRARPHEAASATGSDRANERRVRTSTVLLRPCAASGAAHRPADRHRRDRDHHRRVVRRRVVRARRLAARRRSTTLFTDINSHIDLEVRTSSSPSATPTTAAPATRCRPVSLDTVQRCRAWARSIRASSATPVIIGPDGDAVDSGGAPSFGISWDGDTSDSPIVIQRGQGPERRRPRSSSTRPPPTRRTSPSVTRSRSSPTTGLHPFTVVGLIGLGSTPTASAGRAWRCSTSTPPPRCSVPKASTTRSISRRRRRRHRHRAAGARAGAARQRRGGHPRHAQQGGDAARSTRSSAPFGTGLLIFAFITAFVSAFLINNVFAITIGQRLRELALLRAIGGSGRQVRRLIIVEALIMSVVATIIGIGGGMLVAKLIIGIFNAAGAGFPDFVARAEAAHGADGVPGRRRDHDVRRHHPGPPRRQDPAGRGDATRARLRCAQLETSRRRHRHRDHRHGALPRRAVRPAGRHARSDPARRRRGAADVPRHGERVVDHRQARSPA